MFASSLALRVSILATTDGGLGTGRTPQIALRRAERRRRIRDSFPWSPAEPPVMHVRCKGVDVGYVLVEPVLG